MRSHRGIALLIASAALLIGCTEAHKDVVTIRLDQVRCPNGFAREAPVRCSGQSVDAGVIEFQLFKKERRALVRIAKQDPANFSLPLLEVEGCKIWDAKNWICTTSNTAWTQIYAMENGEYSNTFFGSSGSAGTYRTGTVKSSWLP